MSHTRFLLACWSVVLLSTVTACESDEFTLADSGQGDDGGGVDSGERDSGTDGGGDPCGNGTKDPGEDCDPGMDGCCNATCNGVKAPGSSCRESTGACDAEESCNGTSAACPVDELEPDTTECRPVAGSCDVAENCDGDSADCPDDAFQPNTTSCRAAAGVCDAEETCSGTSADCPTDALQPSTHVCRAATVTCDPAETCSGSSVDCPADGPPCNLIDLGNTSPQSVSGTTAGTCDFWVPPTACSTSTSPEMMYTFTAPKTGLFVFSLDATFDSVLSATTGATCGGTSLACNDDAGNYANSQLKLDLAEGDSVVLAVDGYMTAIGDFTLSIGEWTCNPAYFESGLAADCDCGCGVRDPDCTDGTTASCNYCGDTAACNPGGTCNDIEPQNNAVCSVWTCAPQLYDGNNGCDCGCGILDPDCLDATVASCTTCANADSCSPTGTCADIESTYNAHCRPWTCNIDYLTDTGCDCGCGLIDPYCGTESSSACVWCTGTGYCATTDCTEINPGNSGICI